MLLIETAAATALACAVGVVIVVLGLRPARRLARFIDALDADRLRAAVPVPVSSLPAELRPVGVKLQALLDRVADAFERERRFAAAAAHELRTPIAGMRSLIDLALSRDRDPAEHRRVLTDLSDIVAHSERLTNCLLMLGRAQAVADVRLEDVDMAEPARAMLDAFAGAANERGAVVNFRVEPASVVARVDRDLLTIVLSNLLDNAVEHGHWPGTLSVRLAGHDRRGA